MELIEDELTSKPSNRSFQKSTSSRANLEEEREQQLRDVKEMFNLESEIKQKDKGPKANEMPVIDDPMKEFFEEHDMGITKKDLQRINTKNVLSDRTPNQSKRSDKTFSPKVTKRSGNTFSNEESMPLNKVKDNEEPQNKIVEKRKTRKQGKSKSVVRA